MTEKEANLSLEFESAMDRVLKEGLRNTHNSAIDAAVRMVLLHAIGGTTIAEIAEAVNSLKVEAPTDEHNRPASAPTSEAS